ncbi:MAG TPA: class I SAM-dependent methyltransferase [Bryobacteraceae bacterium]|nr:class I SAM-dependent methyltransferase [Bryobacteraceae bacterium]
MSACLVCGSDRSKRLFTASDRLYHTTAEEFAVVRCGQCGLVRLDPQPAPADLHRYYPDNYWFAPDRSAAGRMEEWYRRVVLRDHVRFVEQALGSSGARGSLLDVGCGGGLFLGLMRQRGFRVAGLDFSPEAAGIAWRRQHVPAVCGMLLESPVRAESCAGVTMFHVLEHLHDPRAYLIAARGLLVSEGRLVVQVPNAACWQFRLLGRSWNGVDVPRHLFDFRTGDLEKLLESCGFEVVRRKYFSLRDNPAGLASSIAPTLDPMARRVRRIAESTGARLAKDLLYFALTSAALPFTALEAACHAGSTIMIEARKR